MLFLRTEYQADLKEQLARYPISMIVAPAGTGKSRLIDSIFTIDGSLDSHSCVIIRFDAQVQDLAAFTRTFLAALNHSAPDDGTDLECIVSAINKLPGELIIVLDDLQWLSDQSTALKLINDIIKRCGEYQHGRSRRWLLGARSSEGLPYDEWAQQGLCAPYRPATNLLLTDEESHYFQSLIKKQKYEQINLTIRDAMLKSAPAQIQTLLVDYASQTNISYSDIFNIEDTRALADCDLLSLNEQCICTENIAASGHELQTNKLETEQARGSNTELLPKSTHCKLYEPSLYVIDLLKQLHYNDVQTLLNVSFLYDLNQDLLSDHASNISELIELLNTVGVAHFDSARNEYRLDSVVRRALQKLLIFASQNTIERAAKIACLSGFPNADVDRAFKLLIHRGSWEAIGELMADYGFDLFERDQLNGIISYTVSRAPKHFAESSPVIAGFLGIVNARVNFTDACETEFRCALESSDLKGGLRRKFQYRYALEVARRADDDAKQHLRELLKAAYSEEEFDATLQSLVHSLSAAVESDSDPVRAFGHRTRALDTVNQIDDAWSKARIYNDCAYASLRLKQYEDAISHASTSLNISMDNGFHDLASRTLSILQVLAYRYQHNPAHSLHYLQRMAFHASRAGESRMLLLSWLGRYWLAIEAGQPEAVEECRSNIYRYLSPDDYMQTQVQSCTVPGAAMIQAWNGHFDEATALVESYAQHEDFPEARAFRWSELSIYFAAQYLTTEDPQFRQRYLNAMQETRDALDQGDDSILQRASILFRMAIACVAMKKHEQAITLRDEIAALADEDQRVEVMCNLIDQLTGFHGEFGQGRSLEMALSDLRLHGLGGIALLIDALPASFLVATH